MFYTLTLNDANEPNYQVRLRITISGEGLTLQSKNDFIPNAINLTYGQPLVLTAADLMAYFRLDRLEVQGISIDQLLQTGGKLPEGLYTICIEAYDYFRFNEAPVSNMACSATSLEELDPPIILAPSGEIDPLSPQNLVFQWQPLHIGNFQVEYTLRLYEVHDGLSYDQVISATTPVFETQQHNLTTFLYGALEPVLEDGHEYLILLSTRDIAAVQVFKNNGVSEIKTFTYRAPCLGPSNAVIEATTQTSITLSWTTPAGGSNSSFLVAYRNADMPNANWYEDEVSNANFHTITGLSPGTAYQIRIAGLCGEDQQSEWLETEEGITEVEVVEFPEYECGEAMDLPPLEAGIPLASAAPGEEFLVNGFHMILEEVTGENGAFTGNGRIKIPFSNKIIKVEFTNIRVNNSRIMYDGDVRGISQYLDIENPNQWNFPPIDIGEDICQPPDTFVGFGPDGTYHPTGLPYDPNGFDVNGNYVLQPPYPGYQEGDSIDIRYDPNGFNAEGVHIETGTIYNPNGCAQTGLDSLGQPCNPNGPGPYYWLQEEDLGPPTEAGLAFADSIRHLIRPMVIQALETLLASNQDSVSETRERCQSYRDIMDHKMAQLGYERSFIYGTEDEYYDEGLHKKFTEEPGYFSINVTRDLNEIGLENAHIDLFECDQDLFIFLDLITLITAQLEPTAVDETVAKILEKINRFTAEEVAQYQDMAALQTWIDEQIDQRIRNLYYQLYGREIGFNDFSPFPALPELLPQNDLFQELATELEAASLLNPLQLVASNNFSLEEIPKPDVIARRAFEFNQGWEYIDGRHRAYYLERMVALRNSAVDNDSLAGFLPAVINKEVAGKTHTIILDNIHFTEQTASMDAFMLLALPNSDTIVFRATGLYFGPSGLTLDEGRLELATDVRIRLSNSAKLIIEASDSTFVAFDCQGFAGMGIQAAVEFCREFVVPLNPETLEVLPDPERVRAHFTVEMPAWGEFIASVSIDPFVIANNENIKWIAEGATLDFSETSSPENIVFPENYHSPYVSPSGQASTLWKGFYLDELTVQISGKLAGDQEFSISVEHLIIDDMGVSGQANASPVLSLDEGKLGGWAFSIDTFSLSVVANQFDEVAFNGLLYVPILKSAQVENHNNPVNEDQIHPKDCLAYDCFLNSDGEYSFSAKTQNSYLVNIWVGEVIFSPGTTVEVSDTGDGLKVLATLHGKITFEAVDLGAGFDLGGSNITFQNVKLSNKSPYFSPGTWEVPEIDIGNGGFALTINNIGMFRTEDPTETALRFDALINLTPSSNMGITACGKFKIIGKLAENNQQQKWQYERFEVDKIFVNASAPGFGVKGELSFFEKHQEFGSGFRGILNAWFKGVNGPDQVQVNTTSCAFSNTPDGTWGITALAQFGSLDAFDYFLVDAMVDFGGGIPMVGPAIKLKAFGGSVYHHMSRTSSGMVQLQNATANPPAIPPLGNSLTGIDYTPNPAAGIGLKATLMLTSITETAMNANLHFEINFNNGGGIDSLNFFGNASFMKTPKKEQPPTYQPGERPENGTPINAYVDICYDFVNHVLSANFEAYAYIANGVLRGGEPNYRMGWADLLFTRNEGWYIKAGSVSQRNSLILGIPGVIDTLVTFQCYLMMGNRDVESIPSIDPDILARIGLYSDDVYDPSRSALVNSGAGFAFGAKFDLNTGEQTFLIFYGSFSLNLGFDISVLDYGDAHCAGDDGPLGINGWYATGQFWAAAEAEIGLKMKIFGRNRRFTILQASAGAILQAQLPNPTWAMGSIGGTFNILGGLVKGNWNMRIKFGHECEIISDNNLITSLSIIDSVQPITDQPVPVNVIPKVNFIVPIEEAFEIHNEQEVEAYIVRFSLDHSQLIKDGATIPFHTRLAEDHLSIEIIPDNFLQRETAFTLVVAVFFEEKVNGTWTEVYEDGELAIQKDTITFTTDEGFDFLVATNVRASYPINGQYNFYRSEYSQHKGYILLDRGQEDLFTNIPEGYHQKIRLTDRQTGQTRLIPLNYDAPEKKISFSLLPQWLAPDHIYKLEIVNVPTDENGDITEQGIDTEEPTEEDPDPADDMPNPGIDNPPPLDEDNPPLATTQVLYTLYFRVSQHLTFLAKATDLFSGLNYTTNSIALATEEPFGVYELNGYAENPPLVDIEALLQESWFQNDIIPFYYDLFPQDFNGWPMSSVNFSRDDRYGFPPNKALRIDQVPEEVLVRYANYASGYFPVAYQEPNTNLKYLVESIIQNDHTSLNGPCIQNIALFEQAMLEQYAGNMPYGNDEFTEEQIRELAESYCPGILPCLDLVASPGPIMPAGNYQIRLKYSLPGTRQTTTIFNTNVIKTTGSN
ncbi:MAG: hypothetical protein DHS20C18_36820 [Saprospiraceae bacterium]|nr:MAG: hypothetical protein DHS20C18_36820 [Saprospiraceae bacterium]